jgi:two-component system nitrate/nitrite sensor histidine kinase NarX
LKVFEHWGDEGEFIVLRSTMKLEFSMSNLQYQRIFEAANDGLIISDLETGIVVEANPAACRMHGCQPKEFIGMQLADFIHPDSRHGFKKYIQACQAEGGFDLRTLELRADGSTFYAEWCGTLITDPGQPCFLGVVRNVSERIQAEQLLHQSVETRTHEQATLLEISHTLASTLELQPGLILNQLRKIIEYTHGGLFTLENSALVTLAMRGTPQLEQSAPIRIYLDTPEALVTLFNEHQPIRIADIGSSAPQAQFLRSLLGNGAEALLEGVQSWMWVPLAVKGRILGGIGVAETRKNYFTAHHADLALSVANQAAITLVNAELHSQAQGLAVLEERQRLARNLHDAVNQSLFSAGLIAEVLPRLWDKNPVEARRSLEDLRRLTRGASAEMRALLAELRPSTFADSSLGDLLHLLGDSFISRTNIPATVTISGEGNLPAETQVTLYHICQEALSNIAKHARASQVDIGLHYTEQPNGLELHIRDNGRGFDPAVQLSSSHYGLVMMRERAETVGATLTIISQPGQGTELVIRWLAQEI